MERDEGVLERNSEALFTISKPEEIYTERTVCLASDRSWDAGNNTEPHSPLQLTTVSLSPVLHWPISMGGQVLWSIPGHPWSTWSEKKPVTSGLVKNLGFL